MLDTVEINHVQHISFAQSRLTDAVSVILSELLSYEHPPKDGWDSLHRMSAALYYRERICFTAAPSGRIQGKDGPKGI